MNDCAKYTTRPTLARDRTARSQLCRSVSGKVVRMASKQPELRPQLVSIPPARPALLRDEAARLIVMEC